MKAYLGIDNGVSGSLAVIYRNGKWNAKKMPIKHELNYTKTKQYLNRIDHVALYGLLKSAYDKSQGHLLVLVERPMLNSTRFRASVSALRALEATLIVIERLSLPYKYIDSKEWQKEMLPKGIKGNAELKKASKQIGERLFPGSSVNKDCDAILIAEWAKRKKF